MKKNLLQGKRYLFNNENYCIEHETGDIRGCEVWYNDSPATWLNGFKIEFNGVLVHSSKTFKAMENKLYALIEKWHLELISIEE